MAPSRIPSRRPRAVLRAVTATAAAALVLSACTGGSGTAGAGDTSGDQLLTIPREDLATFTRNFNPLSPQAAPMTLQAVYEPLAVHSMADAKDTPWLATKWEQAKDGKSLTFTLRDGVKWSDGQALTADDVVYTFELQKKVLGGFDYLDKVTAVDAHTVKFSFNKAFSTAFFEISGHYILPKHIWSKVKDPAKFTNPNPVGTGPYTKVEKFQSQSYELRKNPDYWQPAKQQIAGIQMLAFSGNDSANIAFTNGEVDWTQSFIPDIEKSFVVKDKKHNHYWFPATGAMINWQLNTTKAPFDDPAVRKALSMAVDRDQVTKVAMNGYAEPADCTGMARTYDKWRDTSLAASCTWTKYDTDAAAKALDAAGYKESGGKRKLKDGKNFTLDISVGSASSDWISVANIIKQDLAKVGITAIVKTPDWSAVSSSYNTGTFDTGIVWSNNGATPYEYFRGVMSTKMVQPVGKQATENYHRFGDKKADKLIDAFAAATDECAARADERSAGAVQQGRARRPAVHRPRVGRVHGRPLHRLAHRREPVRHPRQPQRQHDPRAHVAEARQGLTPGEPTAVLLPGRPPRHRPPAPPPTGARPVRLILRNLGFYLLAFWASITLNFVLPRFMPGDPVSRMFAQAQGTMQPDQIAQLRKLFGLDNRPLWEQYVSYVKSVFTGDLGISITRFPTPVTDVIGSQIGWTLLLGGVALVIAAVLGNLLGIVAAWRRGGVLDSAFPPLLIFVGSFPYFWLAMGALYLFGVSLGWFPMRHAYDVGLTPGFNGEFLSNVASHLVLPALTIVLVSIGGWMLGMRNTMIATTAEDYITMAEAKGLSPSRIMFRYAARNALLPSVTNFGMALGFVVGGALLTEVVFAYPGIGYQLLMAVQGLDYPLMQGIFLTITAAVLIANFLVDLVYVRLDPRVRVR